MNLSKNFELWEFEISQTAKRLGIDNSAPPDAVINLTHLASALQHVRDKLGSPIIISSGYRCKEVNKAVGGVEPSSHESGLAADLLISGMTAHQTCLAMMRNAPFYNKIIYEFDGWCHFEVGADSTYSTNAFKNLTIDRRGTQWGFIK